MSTVFLSIYLGHPGQYLGDLGNYGSLLWLLHCRELRSHQILLELSDCTCVKLIVLNIISYRKIQRMNKSPRFQIVQSKLSYELLGIGVSRFLLLVGPAAATSYLFQHIWPNSWTRWLHLQACKTAPNITVLTSQEDPT